MSLPEQPHICAKCGSNMEEGLISSYGGVRWYKDDWGRGGTALKAYKCPKCGYVEIYQRYKNDSKRV